VNVWCELNYLLTRPNGESLCELLRAGGWRQLHRLSNCQLTYDVPVPRTDLNIHVIGNTSSGTKRFIYWSILIGVSDQLAYWLNLQSVKSLLAELRP
jgi:hypothetical protein